MATKSITIDTTAYDLLKRRKLPNESFSEAIKRLLPPLPALEDILSGLRRHPFSRTALAAIEKQVENRRSPANRRR